MSPSPLLPPLGCCVCFLLLTLLQATQPAKQSRLGKLLSRAKGGSGSSAAAATAPSAAVNQETAVSQPAEEDRGAVLPVLSSVAPSAAPTRTGMRSMLFGKSRRQAPGLPNTADAVADDSAEPPGNSWEAVEEETLLQEQAQHPDGGMRSQGSAWQAEYPNSSDIASPAHATASPGSAAFVTPSSMLLTTPSTAMTGSTPVNEAAEKAEVDPLSHRFEEHMLTARQEPLHAKIQDNSESGLPPAQRSNTWGINRGMGKGVTAPEHVKSRAASPSLSDHGSFDPLTATFEEFEAFNRSQEKHLNHVPEQLPAQLPDQSSALFNQQLPQQQQPSAAGTSAQPRKTSSIPRIFRLRKTGSMADVTSTSTAAAADVQPAEAEGQSEPLSPGKVDPNQAGGPPQGAGQGSNPDQGTALLKTRSKPFGLLRKRSKGTAQTLSSRQPLPAAPAPSEAAHTSAPLPEDSTGGHTPQQGLLEDPTKQALADKGAEEPQHVNTVLALSAGLANTFGSFMAASTAASPQESPRGPRQVSLGSHDSEAKPDQVTSAMTFMLSMFFFSFCATHPCIAWEVSACPLKHPDLIDGCMLDLLVANP